MIVLSRHTRCTAFEGLRQIASGELTQVARQTKEILEREARDAVLIFDDATGEQLEVDFRGTVDDVVNRIMESTSTAALQEADATQGSDVPRGPGRPKLGVIAREVTLLPRHWEWLNSQPGGASVALRKLVEAARRANEGKDRLRHTQEAAFRFMSAIAGNLPEFEEVLRALFANNQERFDELIRNWPQDIQYYLGRLMLGDADPKAQPVM